MQHLAKRPTFLQFIDNLALLQNNVKVYWSNLSQLQQQISKWYLYFLRHLSWAVNWGFAHLFDWIFQALFLFHFCFFCQDTDLLPISNTTSKKAYPHYWRKGSNNWLILQFSQMFLILFFIILQKIFQFSISIHFYQVGLTILLNHKSLVQIFN